MVEVRYDNFSGSPLGLATNTAFQLNATDFGSGIGWRMASMDLNFHWDLDGSVNDEHCLLIVLADGNLTLAEVEAALESSYSGPHKTSERAVARHIVIPVGLLSGLHPSLSIRRFKVNQTFHDGLKWYVYQFSADVLQSGSTVIGLTKQYGVWVD